MRNCRNRNFRRWSLTAAGTRSTSCPARFAARARLSMRASSSALGDAIRRPPVSFFRWSAAKQREPLDLQHFTLPYCWLVRQCDPLPYQKTSPRPIVKFLILSQLELSSTGQTWAGICRRLRGKDRLTAGTGVNAQNGRLMTKRWQARGRIPNRGRLD